MYCCTCTMGTMLYHVLSSHPDVLLCRSSQMIVLVLVLLNTNLPVLPFPRTPSAARELFKLKSPVLLNSCALGNQSGPYTTRFGDLWPHVHTATHSADSVGGLDGPLHVFVRQPNTSTDISCGAHFPFFVAGTALQNLVLSTISNADGGDVHDTWDVRGIRCAPRRPARLTQHQLANALSQAADPNVRSHVYFSGAALTVYSSGLNETKDTSKRGADEGTAATSRSFGEVQDAHKVHASFPSSALASLGASLAPLALPLAAGAPAAFPPARGRRPQNQQQGQGAQLLQSHIWLASGGCTTPLHYDTSHNVMLQLAGTKRVMLLSPVHAVQAALLPALSPGHRQSAVLLAGNTNLHGNPQSNRSSIDARGRNSGDKPAGSSSNGALMNAINVTLYPGQSLFVPAYWFHHVTSESTSATQRSIGDDDYTDANGCPGHAHTSPAQNYTLSASLWVESRAHVLGKRLLASADISAPLATLSRRVPLRLTYGARRSMTEQNEQERKRTPWPELALRVAAVRAYTELIEKVTEEANVCAGVDASSRCTHGVGGAEGAGVTEALFSRYRAAFPQIFVQAAGKHCGAKASGVTTWSTGANASTVAKHIWVDDGALRLQNSVTHSAEQLRLISSAAVRALLLANIAEHLLLWAVGANAKNAGRSPWLDALPVLVARCWRKFA